MFESRKRARDEDDLDWQPEIRDHKVNHLTNMFDRHSHAYTSF